MSGKVYLVGAGPGDPKLITLRGLECIAQADVIIYDRLATNLLLESANPHSMLIYVGKREGDHHIPQHEINQMLIEHARHGETVVRLKGGDPLIFGRGGEEAAALAEAGIEFEFVPGVSAGNAVPAYAGIPVTYRGITSTVAFITGHEDPLKEDSDIEWDSLVKVGTLVFYMGMKNLPKIVQQLVGHGLAESTPVAVIRWGTTPRQQTVVGTLSDISELANQAGLKSPCIIIVGEVVTLRDKLAWFEQKPLFGTSVLVTRAKEQAGAFSDSISKLGGQALEVPTISITDPDSFANIDKALERLERGEGYDWVIFTSANGVKFFVRRMKALGKDIRILAGAKVAVIGPATAKAVKNLLINIDLTPKEYVAEGLLEEFNRVSVSGQSILIPRALIARDVLPVTLREMGATVDVAEVYQTVTDQHAGSKIRDLLLAKQVDIATFTSPSTVKNFIKLVGDDYRELMEGVATASIGPVSADAVRDAGLPVDIVAEEYTVPGLVEAIVKAKRES